MINSISLKPEEISNILCKNIEDKNNIFVFPTDIVMNSWIDWIITHPEISNTDAVAFEQFTAWDSFKKDFVSPKKEGFTVVPSILRKMFVTDFIAENASKPQENRLQKIINPSDNYASEADSFTDWLCKNLVSLHFWKKRVDENSEEYGSFDEEDKDYLTLYNAYSAFLEKHKLFEPSWIDDIEFTKQDKTFHIFYPELLEDFSDYKDTFNNVSNINVYTLPSNTPNPKAYFYKDSRSELRQTILQIINLVQNNKADWSEIAISVPNLEVYRPYIEREFSLYGIPYVIKAGTSLTKNNAGRIFREIYDCYNDNFSFETVRTLLLDKCVPWQDKYTKTIEDLIREGNNLRLICTIGNNEDIWERGLSEIGNKKYSLYKNSENKEDDLLNKEESAYYYSLLKFYQSFKNHIKAFFSKDNNTFKNINNSWMSFKSIFLKGNEEFSEDANNILSRCITELNEIIQIEELYKEASLVIPSPYSFFLSEIDKKTYTKQTKDVGVTVFPYRLSSAAYFKYQFVIDASQKNLDISYKRLTYLNNTKRAKLHLTDDDKVCNAGEVFIKLYAKNTCDDENVVHFSASENTFNGFAIPHSKLNIIKEYCPNMDENDYILNETNSLKDTSLIKNIKNLTKSQMDSYKQWKETKIDEDKPLKLTEIVKQDIKDVLVKRYDAPVEDDKLKVTAQGDLAKFFPCPRKWLLQNALKITDDSLETRLMKPFDMGNLNHKILELFMKKFQQEEKVLPYYDKDKKGFFIKEKDKTSINVEGKPYDEEINDILYGKDNIIEIAIKSSKDIQDCPMVKDMLIHEKNAIALNIKSFLKTLLIEFGSNKKNGETQKVSGLGSCTVLGIEKKLMDIANNAFDFYGIIDFYALSPENDIIIIDYKNSKASIPSIKNAKTTEDGKLLDFQMAVYYKLCKANHKRDIAGGYFYSIKDCISVGIDDKYQNDIKQANDNPNPDGELCITRNVVTDYAKHFIDTVNSFDFTPRTSWDKDDLMNVKSYVDCAKCSFKSICRTTYQVAGKDIETAVKTDKE